VRKSEKKREKEREREKKREVTREKHVGREGGGRKERPLHRIQLTDGTLCRTCFLALRTCFGVCIGGKFARRNKNESKADKGSHNDSGSLVLVNHKEKSAPRKRTRNKGI